MIKNKTLILILLFFLGCGCGRIGEDSRFFANQDPVQTFTLDFQETIQKPNLLQESFQSTEFKVRKPPLDILFVIDASGSMSDDQKALVDNFDVFIDSFLELDVDFKIGIISCGNSNNRDTENKLTSAEAKKDETAFKDYFKKKINVGVGMATENLFLSTKNFLETNPTWPRENAYLITIMVSDTNDHSEPSTTMHRGITFANYLKSLKKDDLVKVWADCYH